MKITLLCSDPDHPINLYLKPWILEQEGLHEIELLTSTSNLSGGTLLFLISTCEIVKEVDRRKYLATLVLHASDLPRGRGWSPHIWEIIGGSELITLSLLEAEDKVDSGKLWAKRQIDVPRDLLWNEINHLLFTAEIELIDLAIKQFGRIKPLPQINEEAATYFPKRTPRDSQIDPDKTISEQFNRIRVCDPNRFPAFFQLHGQKYKIILEKIDR